MENKKISQLDPYSGNPDSFDIPGVADGQTLKTNLGTAIQQKITSQRLLSPSDLKTVNGVPLTGQGDIALELNNPFKGWYDSLEGLQTAVGSPAVGDYAYIKGATASDPAAIYECTTAGTWSDSGRTVDASNVQTFETGQAVNETRIIGTPVNDYGNSVVGGVLFEGSNIYEKALDAYGLNPGYGLKEDGTVESTTTANSEIKTFDIKNARYVKISGWSPNISGGYAPACFYDENMGFLSYHHEESSASLSDKIVAVPSGARYVKVYGAYTYPASAKGVYYNTLDGKKLSQYSLKNNIAQATSGTLIDGKLCATELLKLRELDTDVYIPEVFTDYGPRTIMMESPLTHKLQLYNNANEFVHACKVEIPNGYNEVVFLGPLFNIAGTGICYGFFDANDVEVSHFPYEQDTTLPSNEIKIYRVDVPIGAKYFCTNCQIAGIPPLINKGNFFVYFAKNTSLSKYVSEKVCKYRRIVPRWLSGNPVYVIPEIFTFGKGAANAATLIHTPLLQAVGGTNLVISGLDTNKSIGVFEYDDENYRVAKTYYENTTSSVTHTFNKDTSYFVIQGTNLVDDVYMRDLGLELYYMVNDAKLTTFAPRTDNGYQVLAMNVGYNNMASNSYIPNNNLEVEMEYAVDYGMLCLPESYTQEGTPTRLIVFTHGHAVNYNAESTAFNADDIKPEYWLSEGYAILDMDGSVTGTFSGNHDYEPAAINAYETAYQWVIAHFNIRRDGVFSAGRSMGGGMQFSLLRASSIPIIASAPIVPVTSPLGYVLMSMTGNQRKELLAAYGVPSSVLNGVTWTTSSKPYKDLSQAEKDLIVAYQWMFAPYSPGYCINRPFTDAELTLWSEGYAGKNEAKFTALTSSIADSITPYGYNNVPVRMYTCVGDPLVTYYSVVWLHKVLCRAGYNAQIHVFPATQTPQSAAGDHRFEINSENLVTYTNSKGVTLQNVPKVYIEILAFWRRFENQDSVD